MTQKDYQKLAAIFRSAQPVDWRDNSSAVWYEIREQLMDYLRADNPRFDRQRFIAATEEPIE